MRYQRWICIYEAGFHFQIRHIRRPLQINCIPRKLCHVYYGIQYIRILQNVTSYVGFVTSYLFREKVSLADTLKR
jgi:hypothetical protein